MLVQIAVCKCHPKFKPGGAETRPSAGGKGQVDEDEAGVAVSNSNYVEVGGGAGGGGGGGNTFQLKEIEAYAVHTE